MNRVLESLLCPTSGNSVVYRTFVLWRYVRYRDGDHSALPSIRYAFLPRCFPQMMCFRLLNTKWHSYSLSRAKKKRDSIQASNGLRYETIKVKRRGRRWCITDLSYLRSFSVHKRGFAVEVPHKQ